MTGSGELFVMIGMVTGYAFLQIKDSFGAPSEYCNVLSKYDL